MTKRVKVTTLPEPESVEPPTVQSSDPTSEDMEEYFAWVQKNFEFQGVKFVWKTEGDNGGYYFRYEPENPPEGYFRVLMGVDGEERVYEASVSAADSEERSGTLWGNGEASTPEAALRIAIESYAEALDQKAQNLIQHAEMVRRRALPGVPWVELPKSPEWDGN
jgi:hypothetical protein